MFKVSHFNFGNERDFASLADAMAFVVKSAFDAVVYRKAEFDRFEMVGQYSAVGGWYKKPKMEG